MGKMARRQRRRSRKGEGGDLTRSAYLEISATPVTPMPAAPVRPVEDRSRVTPSPEAEQPAQMPSPAPENPTTSATLEIRTVGGTVAVGTTVPASETHVLFSIVAIPISVIGAVATAYVGARYAVHAVDWFLGLAGLELVLPTSAVFRICRRTRDSRRTESLPTAGPRRVDYAPPASAQGDPAEG